MLQCAAASACQDVPAAHHSKRRGGFEENEFQLVGGLMNSNWFDIGLTFVEFHDWL